MYLGGKNETWYVLNQSIKVVDGLFRAVRFAGRFSVGQRSSFQLLSFCEFLENRISRLWKANLITLSIGQAERLVKSVKEITKKYLMDLDISELDLEDQINLLLFNFRNKGMKGYFPMNQRQIFRFS